MYKNPVLPKTKISIKTSHLFVKIDSFSEFSFPLLFQILKNFKNQVFILSRGLFLQARENYLDPWEIFIPGQSPLGAQKASRAPPVDPSARFSTQLVLI